MKTLPSLRLKKNEDRRLRAGHVWIYSNEIDAAATPFAQLPPGQLVVVENAMGRALGTAYVNPQCLLCARLVSRKADVVLDDEFFVERLKAALALRERLFEVPYYRWVFGESDDLPGLVIDRFGDVIALQITTAGMECVQSEVASAIVHVLPGVSVLLRNDTSVRTIEGLAQGVSALVGEPPKEVMLEENGVRFVAPLWEGQKTGWFYDHRPNRAALKRYVRGKRVLDVFSYVGGWGVSMAVWGAREVVCVDSSARALEYVQQNATLNQVGDRVKTLAGDVFEVLEALKKAGEMFDVVVLDPPAFIKRRKDIPAGTAAYQRLNTLAMHLLAKDGILVTASCSLHFTREMLMDAVRRAGLHTGRRCQILEQGTQGPDHPVHPAIPETQYLKAMIVKVE